MRPRVFVRGIGAVTPLAPTWIQSRERLARGESAVLPVTHFDVKDFPSTVAASIPQTFDLNHDRRLALAECAAAEAWQQGGIQPERLGIFVGAESGRASPQTILELSQAAGGDDAFDHEAFGALARTLSARIDASSVSPAAVASHLAKTYAAKGPVETISLACSSGAAAIAEAVCAIRLGHCDSAICGGVGADVDPFMMVGFGKLGALSARGSSCPFDVRRDGFVVGEGAAFLILSKSRGDAQVEITGIGRSLDAYHLTKPDPEGGGAVRAMGTALEDAGQPSVDYIQAHGTSTPLNDAVEAKAILSALPRANEIPVSSVKGAVGHWIAGAGAVGALCAVDAIVHQEVLPTAGLSQPDPQCPLRHVMGKAMAHKVHAAMVNAFAFGGANTSLILEQA